MRRPFAGIRTLQFLAVALLAFAFPGAAQADRQRDPGLREIIQAAIKSTACFDGKYDDVVWYALMQPRVETRLRQQPVDLRLGDDLRKAAERILHAVHCESSKHAMLRDRPQLVLAVIDVESAFDPFAVSSAGAVGLMQPLKVSCMDHEGGGAVKFIQWDGRKWNVITDWITSDQSIVRPMIEASAAQYAKEKGITPRDCSKEK